MWVERHVLVHGSSPVAITGGYRRIVVRARRCLQAVTGGYRRLQAFTSGYKRAVVRVWRRVTQRGIRDESLDSRQPVTGGYRRLQAVTSGWRRVTQRGIRHESLDSRQQAIARPRAAHRVEGHDVRADTGVDHSAHDVRGEPRLPRLGVARDYGVEGGGWRPLPCEWGSGRV